jgi:hypothetical protein
MKSFFDNLEENIARTGRSVIGVFPTEDEPDRNPPNGWFQYSIGNTLKGYPELLVIGFHDNGWLINMVSKRMIENKWTPPDGEKIDLGGKYPILAVHASPLVKERFTIQAGEYLCRHYDVIQLVVPDQRGRFPGEKGCAEPYSKVRVFRRSAIH